MARTLLNSGAIPLELSFDGGVTWKQLVCVTDANDPMSVGNTETETLNCGTLQGLGAEKFEFTGNAVADFTPGSTLVSRKDLETAMLAKQTLKARKQYPGAGSGSSGAVYYKAGDVVVIEVAGSESPNDLVKFSYNIKGTGIPVIVAP